MTHLVRLSKIKKTHPDFPFEPSTLYKMRVQGRFPNLFIKLGGAVFVDLTALEKIIEAGRRGKVA
jgi:hypothetical protein